MPRAGKFHGAQLKEGKKHPEKAVEDANKCILIRVKTIRETN